jgi:3-oxoacyl-[acyl-carrier-protein] synthase II
MVMGSAGAFLILESRQHAEARGVKPYARIKRVLADRCSRQPGEARKVAEDIFGQMKDQIPAGPLPVLSGCCGVQPQLNEELDFLNGLSGHGIDPVIRGTSSVFGNTLEAQFPVNVILASLAISRGAFFDPFDTTGVEKKYSGAPERVLISTWGHWRGESLALVEKPGVPLRGDE